VVAALAAARELQLAEGLRESVKLMRAEERLGRAHRRRSRVTLEHRLAVH
jgi:hypothetical protein